MTLWDKGINQVSLFSEFDPAPQLPKVDEALTWLPPAGRRVGRLLLLSDIHANWHALAEVLQAAHGEYDAAWFLGDIVGYGPRPLECVEFLQRGLACRGRWVAGNHDLYIVGRLQKGFEMLGDAKKTGDLHRGMIGKLRPDLWAWLTKYIQPKRARRRRNYGHLSGVFVHATPQDPIGTYLYPNDLGLVAHCLRAAYKICDHNRQPTTILFAGHTHMPALFTLSPTTGRAAALPIPYGRPILLNGACYLINPGSVGQPRDGDRRAAYAILDVDEKTITYYRVDYPVKKVQYELRDDEHYSEELVRRQTTATVQSTVHFECVYERLADGSGLIVRQDMG